MAPKYHVSQSLFYDPSGQQGANQPSPHDRATVQAVDTSTDPATYTVTVLKPRPGGGVTPQKPDLTGVAETSLYLPPSSGTA